MADINYWRWCLQYVIWQIMKDYIMECPTIPSSIFAGPVAAGFRNAMNATFLETPSNDVQVAQFWQGVTVMAANTRSASLDATNAATKLALGANTVTTAGVIAPLTNTPGNFTNPDQFVNAIGAFPMWRNSSTVATQIASDPSAFPAAYFCPVGQGADFIKAYRDLSPENPAATNVVRIPRSSFSFVSDLTLTNLDRRTVSTWHCLFCSL